MGPDTGQRRFVALDRDGTINVERHYLSDPDEVELLPGAAEGICAMREMGLPVVVVTNQSGIARGYFGADRLEAIHERMRSLLAQQGAAIDAIHICPHHPAEACGCRKPAPGLLETAAGALGREMTDAVVIGDKPCDVDLGRRAGAGVVLVRTGYGREWERRGEVTADYIAEDLRDAADYLRDLLAADRDGSALR